MQTNQETPQIQLLGEKTIDADHEEFVSLASNLMNAPKEEFQKLFTQLINHSEQHFKMEEELMDKYNYPGKSEHCSEHCSEHNRLLNELRSFQLRVQSGRITLARAYIKSTILDWLSLHIANMDTALVVHVEKLR